MEARPQKTSAVVTLYSDSDIDGLLQERGKLDSALRKHKSKLAILFTDIVGSTSFFERYGDTAGLIMLHRHDMLVMPAVEDAGGTVVKTIGDAVLATFPEADKAVEAAIQIQRRLEQHNRHQTEEEKIYVRVGINFGTGIVKDKDRDWNRKGQGRVWRRRKRCRTVRQELRPGADPGFPVCL
jgi:class 3 adenylate cyclase